MESRVSFKIAIFTFKSKFKKDFLSDCFQDLNLVVVGQLQCRRRRQEMQLTNRRIQQTSAANFAAKSALKS